MLGKKSKNSMKANKAQILKECKKGSFAKMPRVQKT